MSFKSRTVLSKLNRLKLWRYNHYPAGPSAADSAPSAGDSATIAADSVTTAADYAPSENESAPSAIDLAPSAIDLAPSETEAPSNETSSCARRSPLGIQLLPPSLHEQVFPGGESKPGRSRNDPSTEKAIDHLKSHELWDRSKASTIPDVEFPLPSLRGATLDEHFRRIAEDQIRPYKEALDVIVNCDLPPRPEKWSYSPGWTKYPSVGCPVGAEPCPVPFPDGTALVFDVETLVKEKGTPTIAVAVSETNWFSWCAEKLIDGRGVGGTDSESGVSKLDILDLIPLEHPDESCRQPKVVVGHNVAFDRSYVREQYDIDPSVSQLRFVDTMSFHIAVAGLAFDQRRLYATLKSNPNPRLTNKYGKERILDWIYESTTNALKEVYEFYCGKTLSKDDRKIFTEGGWDDVRKDFDSLMDYCATDVYATHQVLKRLAPKFFSRFPHPVSFGGTLEMGRCFLPVDDTWDQFVRNCDEAYDEALEEQRKIMRRLAASACRQTEDRNFEKDPWLWNLDWTTQPIKINKEKPVKPAVKRFNTEEEIRELCDEKGLKESETQFVLRFLTSPNPESLSASLNDQKRDVLAVICRVKGIPMSGRKKLELFELIQNWSPPKIDEPAAKKLEIEKEYDTLLGALKTEFPDRPDEEIEAEARERLSEPLPNDLVKSVLRTHDRLNKTQTPQYIGYPGWFRLYAEKWKCGENSSGFAFGPSISTKVNLAPLLLKMSWREFPLHFMPEHGWGYLVPPEVVSSSHSPLVQNIFEVTETAQKKELQRLGYPPSKEYDADWEEIEARLEGRMRTDENFEDLWEAVRELRSQSKNPDDLRQDRLQDEVKSASNRKFYDVPELPGVRFYKIPRDQKGANVGDILGKDFMKHVKDKILQPLGPEDSEQALKLSRRMSFWLSFRKRVHDQMVVRLSPFRYAILPRLITAGTISRRGVEKTWLTAANPKPDSIGSEIKSVVRAPEGWSFVGADVDSQEYWIAALLGDARFGKQHGCTALGWMLLQGKREDETDLHSLTAKTAGCTRDQAKMLNYSRIYGSGLGFAKTMLMEFNPELNALQAAQNAEKMFRVTKGLRQFLSEKGNVEDSMLSKSEKKRLKKEWIGGTESHMFNQLEEIANSPAPRTPTLGARISKAVEPSVVGNDFLGSRVNWVVQSSAVDYLHLLLVGMRYLFDTYGIQGRISLPIHDEVRFLVHSRDEYRAALALQVVNLWTRALFASKVGIDDLPLAVAFFSTVEVDKVLRKSPTQDSVTPSNPAGLLKEYGIGPGEALNIYQILEKTKGSLEVDAAV